MPIDTKYDGMSWCSFDVFGDSNNGDAKSMHTVCSDLEMIRITINDDGSAMISIGDVCDDGTEEWSTIYWGSREELASSLRKLIRYLDAIGDQ